MTKTERRLPVVLLAAGCLAAPPALAGDLPAGGRVAQGAVDVATPSPGRMTIRQSSGKAVVNWRDFSIGRDARVDIRQPSASSALLNRVDGSARSTIAGALTANGRVYLVNPNGVLITETDAVHTGSFVASTLHLSDADFLAGRDLFIGGAVPATVENRGRIAIERGGYAALLGGAVDNSGIVSVPLGKVGFGSARRATLDPHGDGFLQVELPAEIEAEATLIRNSGRVAAEGGRVEMLAATARHAARNAINLSGLVEARSVGVRDGKIVLGGGPGGAVRVSGRLDASAPAKPAAARKGGEILVTGETIALTAATLDASGPEGGGRVRIGGDWGGEGTLQRAATTHVDAATLIRADAGLAGDGGDVVVWSDQRTDFLGRISARGGPEGGDGGAAEVSAPLLAFGGSVDLSAPRGAIGDLLLDPYNVFIEDIDSGEVQEILDADDNVVGFVWPATVVENVLSDVDLTIETTGDGEGPSTGDITIGAPLAWDPATTLTLLADNDIIIAQPIAAPAGGLTLNATGTITTPATWIDSGGNSQTGGNGAIGVGVFTLAGGDWIQNAAVLPDFAATDFRIPGGSYLRALGGTGDPGQPFELESIFGLAGMGSSAALLASAYVLADDLDAGGTQTWNNLDTPGGFAPIGSDAAPFVGSLDGGGFEIDGLFIDSPAPRAGLFGVIGAGGSVTDLALVNVDVSGVERTGGLAGTSAGTIEGVSVTGAVAALGAGGDAEFMTGGLVGENTGTISAAFSTATVTLGGGALNLLYAGGLAGANGGTITGALATGDVTATGVAGGVLTTVGGLVGLNSGQVTRTTASGAAAAPGVEDFRIVGGLVGENTGSVTLSYASGPATAPIAAGDIGGLVGLNSGAISQTYASGLVLEGADFNGGLVGINAGGTITSSFWDVEATGQAASAGGGVGLTTAQLQDTDGFMALAEAQGWDFETDWAPPGPGGDGGFYPEIYALSPVVRIDADDDQRVYGADNPALTATQSGGPDVYLFGPEADTLTVPFGLTSDATPENNVGAYDIVVDAPGFVDSAGGIPYRVVATDGVLTVTPADLTVIADDQRKIYGESFTFLGTEFSVEGLRNDDTVTSATIASDGAPGTAGAGFHVIGIDAAVGEGLGNYVIAYEAGEFTVGRAPLTVTADDQRKTLGRTFVFNGTEFSVAGLRNDDRVTRARFASDGAPASARVGTYSIDVSGARGEGLGNYDIAYVPGVFTVAPPAPQEGVAAPSRLVTVDPGLPNPDDAITLAVLRAEGLETGGGGPALETGEAAVEAAERTLARVARISDDLAARTRDCELGRPEVDQYLACIGDGLGAYARGIGDLALDLPEPLRAVSAIIEDASRGVARSRAAAAQRRAGAASPGEIREIERQAVAEVRAVVGAAIDEIERRIELIRADDADVARFQAQQGRTIAAALEAVDEGLARVTEL